MLSSILQHGGSITGDDNVPVFERQASKRGFLFKKAPWQLATRSFSAGTLKDAMAAKPGGALARSGSLGSSLPVTKQPSDPAKVLRA
jgi:hypothetical protein